MDLFSFFLSNKTNVSGRSIPPDSTRLNIDINKNEHYKVASFSHHIFIYSGFFLVLFTCSRAAFISSLIYLFYFSRIFKLLIFNKTYALKTNASWLLKNSIQLSWRWGWGWEQLPWPVSSPLRISSDGLIFISIQSINNDSLIVEHIIISWSFHVKIWSPGQRGTSALTKPSLVGFVISIDRLGDVRFVVPLSPDII